MAIAKDTREFQAMSVADADALLMQLARLSAELKKKAAAAEKRKAEIDIQLAADTAEQQQEYDRLFDRLTEYIQAHPERFVRPRNHQVKGVGSYGIEIAPDRYKTVDESLVIEYSDANGLALYQLVPARFPARNTRLQAMCRKSRSTRATSKKFSRNGGDRNERKM